MYKTGIFQMILQWYQLLKNIQSGILKIPNFQVVLLEFSNQNFKTFRSTIENFKFQTGTTEKLKSYKLVPNVEFSKSKLVLLQIFKFSNFQPESVIITTTVSLQKITVHFVFLYLTIRTKRSPNHPLRFAHQA